MILNKKGQGLSLNVIIVAAIALIVLVVLIMIFTGRLGIFQNELDKAAQTELTVMKSLKYGQCHPDSVTENRFLTVFSQLTDDNEKAVAKDDFEFEINNCKSSSSDQGLCESTSGCKWG